MKKPRMAFVVKILIVCGLVSLSISISEKILYTEQSTEKDPIKEAILKLKSDEAKQREKGKQEILKRKEKIEELLKKDNKNQEALEMKKRTVEELLKIVKTNETTYKYCAAPKPEDSKFMAIELWGEFLVSGTLVSICPSEEAIELLIDNVFYGRNPHGLSLRQPPFYGGPPTPAVTSLIKIGEPVAEKVLERIKNIDIRETIVFIYPQKTKLDKKIYPLSKDNEKWEKGCISDIYAYIIEEIYGKEKAIEFIKKQIDKEKKKIDEEKKGVTQFLKNLKQIARWWRDELDKTHYIDKKWWSK